MDIHERLKSLRESKDVRQKEVASFIGVSERVYGYYEKDRFPRDETILSKLAEYFNVSIEYLLGKTDDKNEGKLKDMLGGNEFYQKLKASPNGSALINAASSDKIDLKRLIKAIESGAFNKD